MDTNPPRIKSAAPGYFWAVSGTIRQPAGLLLSSPVVSKELHILHHGGVMAKDAFIMDTVQSDSRLVLVAARRPVGDIEFEAAGFSFSQVAQESATLATVTEAKETAEAIARSPIGHIEAELTGEVMNALHDRLNELAAGQSRPVQA